jgi:hypothetical protein
MIVASSPFLTSISETTQLLLALIAAALLAGQALIPGTARHLLIGEILKLALTLPFAHPTRCYAQPGTARSSQPSSAKPGYTLRR